MNIHEAFGLERTTQTKYEKWESNMHQPIWNSLLKNTSYLTAFLSYKLDRFPARTLYFAITFNKKLLSLQET